MIVDSHQHFWDLGRGDYTWLTPDAGVLYRNFLPGDLAQTLRAQGVSATIVVQAAATEAETHFLFSLAALNPFIAGVVGWLDFENPAVADRVAALAAAGGGKLKGLRPMIQDIADPEWVTRHALDAAFEALAPRGLVFDALVRPRHLRPLRERLLRHSTLRAVLDHAGKPDIVRGELDSWARDLERLARDTSVCCKLSGLLTEAGARWSTDDIAPYVAHVFSCFGPERILWGSDWPVLTSIASYADWLRLSQQLIDRFAPGRAHDVLALNAARLYGLELH
jgi:L-fuconolactonase